MPFPNSSRILTAIACLAFTAGVNAAEQACYGPRAQTDFLMECAACHRPDGTGSVGTIPSLHEYLGTFSRDPKARAFASSVSGAANSPLNDAELADVLNWIICTMDAEQIQAGFQPYTAQEVARYRKAPLVDAMKTRSQLLDQLGLRYPDH